jgi:trans-aconitate methyltransferase
MKSFKPSFFEKIFNARLRPCVKKRINKYNFTYRETTPQEQLSCIQEILNVLLEVKLPKAGKRRFLQWEKGWGQNLKELSRYSRFNQAVIPHYFGKYKFVRINRKLIRPLSKNFEYHSLAVILDWLFDRYLKRAKTVYEFGCGTGHHLFHLRQINPSAKLWGLDWTSSSQKIIRNVAQRNSDLKLFARIFDFFRPDYGFKLDQGACVYTVASLEQVGFEFKKFVDYLLKNKPKLCVHVEPVAELLDERNLWDYFSIKYIEKRNYLRGFLTYLRQLEKQGKIRVLKARRTYIGSLFIEGYSVIIWTPL